MRRRLDRIKGKSCARKFVNLPNRQSLSSSANDVAKVKSNNRSAEFKVSKNTYLSRENVQLGLNDGTKESREEAGMSLTGVLVFRWGT